MNIAVKNILRSIIAKHGTDIAYNPRLCDAILSDLMPDYPAERRRLVRSVTAGIPATLLSGQKPKPAQTAGPGQLSRETDAMAIELWRHALQDRLPGPVTHRRHARSYLSGMVTTLIIMTISSAIAFYKRSGQNDLPPEPLTGQHNTPAVTISGPAVITKPQAPAPPMQVASVDLQHLQLLDQLKTVKLQLPTLPLAQQENLTQAAEQAAMAALEQAEQQELQQVTAQAARKLASQSLAKAEHQRLQKMTAQAAREQAAREQASREQQQRAETEKRHQQALQETARRQQQQAGHQARFQAEETRIALKALLLDSVSFGREMVSLEKKRTDLKTLQNLYQLTGENFYATQMLMVNNKIRSLEKNLNTLSANYTDKMNNLCKVSPQSVNHGLRSLPDSSRSAGMESVAHQLLSRHVRICQHQGQAVAGSIKNELMASYGHLIRQ
ncbi:MAG: hypothetical protein KDI44_17585 [Thiothrix sp.]|nr:hypothetical protein [Thiothrix sp.]